MFGSAQTWQKSSVRLKFMRTVRIPIKFFALATTASIFMKSFPMSERWNEFTVRKVDAEPSECRREWFVIVRLELQER
jgi:hypothetical protein